MLCSPSASNINPAHILRIVTDARLTPEAVRVVAYIAALGSGEHEVDAEVLCVLLGCAGDKPVRAAVRRATTCGYLSWRQGGRGHHNRYTYLAAGGEVKADTSPQGESYTEYLAAGGEVNAPPPPPPSPPTITTPHAHAHAGHGLDDPAIPALRAALGDHASAVDAFASSAEHCPNWATLIHSSYRLPGTLGQHDGGGTHAARLQGLNGRAGAVLAGAMMDYAGTGKRYEGTYFRRFVETAIREESGAASASRGAASAVPFSGSGRGGMRGPSRPPLVSEGPYLDDSKPGSPLRARPGVDEYEK